MKKTIKVYMDEDLYEKAKATALSRNMSLSALACSLLLNGIDLHSSDTATSSSSDGSCTLRLNGEAATRLRCRAQKAGLTPTAYVRDIILFQNMTEVKVEASIGKEILHALNEYDRDLNRLMSLYADPSDLHAAIIDNQKSLTNLVLKYQKSVTRAHSDLIIKTRKMLKEL